MSLSTYENIVESRQSGRQAYKRGASYKECRELAGDDAEAIVAFWDGWKDACLGDHANKLKGRE